KMLGVAIGIDAAAHMARLLRLGRPAAHAAETVPAVPIENAARISHQRAVAVADQRTDAAQIGEFERLGRTDRRQRLVERREIAREETLVADLTEEHFGKRIADDLVAQQE